jgi:hypothetical protein
MAEDNKEVNRSSVVLNQSPNDKPTTLSVLDPESGNRYRTRLKDPTAVRYMDNVDINKKDRSDYFGMSPSPYKGKWFGLEDTPEKQGISRWFERTPKTIARTGFQMGSSIKRGIQRNELENLALARSTVWDLPVDADRDAYKKKFQDTFLKARGLNESKINTLNKQFEDASKDFEGSQEELSSAKNKFFKEFSGMTWDEIEIAQGIRDTVDYTEVKDEINKLNARNTRLVNDAWFKATGDENMIDDIAGGFASVGVAAGLSLINPALTVIAFGAMKKEDMMTEMLNRGIGYEQAEYVSTAAGLAEGGIEAIGVGKLTNLWKDILSGNRALSQIVDGFAIEAMQEGAQTAAEEGIMQGFGGRKKDVYDTLTDVGYSMVVGGIVGAGSAGIAVSASKELVDLGVEPEQADQMVVDMITRTGSSEELKDETLKVFKRENSHLALTGGNYNTAVDDLANKIKDPISAIETKDQTAEYTKRFDELKATPLPVNDNAKEASFEVLDNMIKAEAFKTGKPRVEVMDAMNISFGQPRS